MPRFTKTTANVLSALHSNGFCSVADLARWLAVAPTDIVDAFDDIALSGIRINRTRGLDGGASLVRAPAMKAA